MGSFLRRCLAVFTAVDVFFTVGVAWSVLWFGLGKGTRFSLESPP